VIQCLFCCQLTKNIVVIFNEHIPSSKDISGAKPILEKNQKKKLYVLADRDISKSI
jgi:hypothetical protein